MNKIHAGEMPPKKKPRADAALRAIKPLQGNEVQVWTLQEYQKWLQMALVALSPT